MGACCWLGVSTGEQVDAPEQSATGDIAAGHIGGLRWLYHFLILFYFTDPRRLLRFALTGRLAYWVLLWQAAQALLLK